MKKCKMSSMRKLTLILFLIIGFGLNAQTAEEIIHQNLENSGGIKNWKNLNSIIMRGDAILSLEQSFPMVVYHKRPYQKKVVFIIEGKELLNEGYDGKNGWTYNSISGKNEILETYQPDSFESDILDYKKKGFEAKYLGKSNSEGKECYMVELTKNVNQSIYCFSTEDYSTLWEENKDLSSVSPLIFTNSCSSNSRLNPSWVSTIIFSFLKPVTLPLKESSKTVTLSPISNFFIIIILFIFSIFTRHLCH